MPALLVRTVADVVAARPEPDDPALEAVGFLGSMAGAEVYRETLASVILPGFDAAGVDTAPARARVIAAHERARARCYPPAPPPLMPAVVPTASHSVARALGLGSALAVLAGGAALTRGALAQPRRPVPARADASVAPLASDASTTAPPARDGGAAAPPECPEGLAPVDSDGHCCTPGQRWAAGRCAGTPTGCPPGQAPAATDAGVGCAPRTCEAGRERAADGVHCCWPGQTYRARENTCRAERPDVVRCPEGTAALGAGDCAPRVGVALNAPPRGRAAPAGMVFVGGGTFRMGGPNAARYVTLGPYWIDRTEVTAAAYARCVAARRCPAAVDASALGARRAPGAPAVNVTHAMAQAYCAFAGGRLPTEAEWEFAARGADGRVYPWGDRAPDCALARFAGCEPAPAPAGSLRAGASPFGALEMAGNVAEWTADRGGAPLAATGSARDPFGPVESSSPTASPASSRRPTRVVRGGAFDSPPALLRATARVERDGREARYDTGFRCVQVR